MEQMNEVFVPKLNAFIELLKETQQIHVDHLMLLSRWQLALRDGGSELEKVLRFSLMNDALTEEASNAIAGLTANHQNVALFEKSLKAYREIYRQHIEDTNFQLGMFSTHWGGYIENLGVQYMLNSLRKEYGVHTSFQKFKRYWHKSRNVEIDLLAISDTHAYVVEVKNQLKPAAFIQMLTILDKIKQKVPEYAHLQLQPVFFCVHAAEDIVRSTTMAGLWIVRYKGFDRTGATDSFEWLGKDVS